MGVQVIGVSFDRPEDNLAFGEKHGFPFRLLSDVDREVGERYETKRADKEKHPEYAKRRTYVIDPDGVIRKAYRVTDIPAHPGEVLDDLRGFMARGVDPPRHGGQPPTSRGCSAVPKTFLSERT